MSEVLGFLPPTRNTWIGAAGSVFDLARLAACYRQQSEVASQQMEEQS